MREKFVLNGDGVVRVRFVDNEEEGEKKAGGGSKHKTRCENALRNPARLPPVVS
jgi:hypothetical protein